jgi:hypothetical protein
MIGLKLANGRFFPVLEETDTGAKRVVLTTAHSNQSQVKVDLYRGIRKAPPPPGSTLPVSYWNISLHPGQETRKWNLC